MVLTDTVVARALTTSSTTIIAILITEELAAVVEDLYERLGHCDQSSPERQVGHPLL